VKSLVGRVGLEPTTGGLWEVRPGAPGALSARIPRSRGADGADCTVCTDGSVHEPVHDHHSERLMPTTERYQRPPEIGPSARSLAPGACRSRPVQSRLIWAWAAGR